MSPVFRDSELSREALPIELPNLDSHAIAVTLSGLGRGSNPHLSLIRLSTYQTLHLCRLRILTAISALSRRSSAIKLPAPLRGWAGIEPAFPARGDDGIRTHI